MVNIEHPFNSKLHFDIHNNDREKIRFFFSSSYRTAGKFDHIILRESGFGH
jgi:hypothetical protein